MSKALIRQSIVVLAGTILVGCASPGPYKMYEGPDKPAAETAAIKFPYVLEVMAMNGEKATLPPSVTKSDATYELVILPGYHEMAVRYADPFANYEDTDGSDRGYQIDKTAPFFLTFEAIAGCRYTVEYQTAKQDSSLKRNEVKVWIVDQGSGEISGKMSGNEKRVGKGLPEATSPAESAQVVPAVVVDTSGKEVVELPSENPPAESDKSKQLPSINAADQLKFWWYRANAEERKDFLRWMREEK